MASTEDSVGVEVFLDDITHRYGDAVAVNRVSLKIQPGELVALLGPSGCGKTTLLRIVAGLISQSSGSISIGGQQVDRLAPNERGAGIVFQNYALFPHMNVERNVGFGLRARGVSEMEIHQTVSDMLEMVQMSQYAKRYPRELSGGQQQRVALARTLAVKPRVLLLDEPFAALDKNLRLDMQIEIRRIQRELGITTLIVTHDQEEAMSMADRIAVMSAGNLEQFDAPECLYDSPSTLFVAGFVGTTNLIEGKLTGQPGSFYFSDEKGACQLEFPHASPCSRPGNVVFSARPEHLLLTSGDPGNDVASNGIPAKIVMVLPLGPSVVYELVRSDGKAMKVVMPRNHTQTRMQVGDKVVVRVRDDAPVRFFLR